MAVMPAAMRLRAAGAARARNETGSAIPYDAAASFELQGKPGRVVAGVINIDVDGTFVATAIGYGLEEDCRRAFELPVIVPFGTDTAGETFRLGDIRLGDIPPDVLIDGFRVRPDPAFIDGNTTGPRVPLDRVIAQASRSNVLEHRVPRSDVSFFFSLIDSNSGRELQDEPVNNLASLGKANGERPFRVLPQPLSFAPRSTVRLQVIENSEGVRGTLFIVLYGYKLLAASHCPESVVRALRASADCPGEIIGLPTDHFLMLARRISGDASQSPSKASVDPPGANAEKKFGVPANTSSTAVMPDCTIVAAVTALRAVIPPSANAFSTWSLSRIQVEMPEACCAA